MKYSRPPAIPAWLLENIRFSKSDDAIAGDLLEELSRGRSAAWYWRQALLAILVGMMSEVRQHRLQAIRASLITWVASYTAVQLSCSIMSRLFNRHSPAAPVFLTWFGSFFLVGCVSGLLLASLHRTRRNEMLLIASSGLYCGAFLWVLKMIAVSPYSKIPLTFLAGSIVFVWLLCAAEVVGQLIGARLSRPVQPASQA